MAGAPSQQSMDGAVQLEAVLSNKSSVLVKQTARGCLQECMGCEAKSEYKISSMDQTYMKTGGWLKEGAMSQRDELYALEESSFCMRCCWRDGRSMHINVTAGAEAGGPPVMHYTKPCGCPLFLSIPSNDGTIDCPCCCFLPELATKTPDGQEISRSKYICDLYCCVSKFAYMEDNQEVYRLKPATCCGGCCPTCKCGRQISVPYYFHNPETGARITDGEDDDDRQPQIRKVWAGLRKECCTTADTFAVFFPKGASARRKAGLLGLTFLLDFTIFERQGQEAA